MDWGVNAHSFRGCDLLFSQIDEEWERTNLEDKVTENWGRKMWVSYVGCEDAHGPWDFH